MRAFHTYQEVSDLLNYNAETGEFHWRNSRKGVTAGEKAGTIGYHGYRIICIHPTTYRACRLAWLLMHKRWLAYCIDHINHNKTDDRLLNLREATHQQNLMNQSRKRLKGVSKAKKEGRWRAYITVNYAYIALGIYDTPEQAAREYDRAARIYFGEFAYYNFPEEQNGL